LVEINRGFGKFSLFFLVRIINDPWIGEALRQKLRKFGTMPVNQVFKAMWRSRMKRKRGNASETPTRHSATTGTHRDEIRRRLPSVRMRTRTTTAETRTSAQLKAEMGDPKAA
jgi:hypothetical protein